MFGSVSYWTWWLRSWYYHMIVWLDPSLINLFNFFQYWTFITVYEYGWCWFSRDSFFPLIKNFHHLSSICISLAGKWTDRFQSQTSLMIFNESTITFRIQWSFSWHMDNMNDKLFYTCLMMIFLLFLKFLFVYLFPYISECHFGQRWEIKKWTS